MPPMLPRPMPSPALDEGAATALAPGFALELGAPEAVAEAMDDATADAEGFAATVDAEALGAAFGSALALGVVGDSELHPDNAATTMIVPNVRMLARVS